MKYEKEVNESLRLMFYESWMDEQEYQEIINETFVESGITKQWLSDKFQEGVDDGYSIEFQMELIRSKYKQK